MTKNCDISNFQAFPIPDLQKVGFVEYHFFFWHLGRPRYLWHLTSAACMESVWNGVLVSHKGLRASDSQRTTQLTSKSWFGHADGTSFQMPANHALALQAGTSQRWFCFVRFIKSLQNLEVSLLVVWPIVSLSKGDLKKSSCLVHISVFREEPREVLFHLALAQKWSHKITAVVFVQTHPFWL